MSNPYSPDPWERSQGQQPPQPPPYGQPYGQQPPGGPQYPPGQPPQQPPQQPPGGSGYPPPGGGQQPGAWGQPEQQQWGQPGQQQWGQPGAQSWGQPEAGWDYGGYGAYGAYQQVQRPGTVLVAAIATYIGSAVLVVVGVVMMLGAASSEFAEGFASAAGVTGLDAGALRGVLVGLGVFLLVMGVVLIFLAVLAQKGRNWARIALTIIGVIWIIPNLISIFTGAGPSGAAGVAWIGGAVALFWAGKANEWYRAQKAAR